MTYIGTQPIPKATTVRSYGTLESDTTTIDIAGGFTPDNIEVYIDGSYVLPNDYDDSDGFNIVFTETLPTGTDYIVMEVRSFQSANHYTKPESDNKYAQLTGTNDFTSMPSVGGNPIVESGSNSDGEWTRWADGTQECRFLSDTVYTASTAANSVYLSNRLTFTFALPFLQEPSIAPAPKYNGTGSLIWGAIVTATAVDTDVYLYSHASSGTGNAGFRAMGNWK